MRITKTVRELAAFGGADSWVEIGPSLESLVKWLEQEGLTRTGREVEGETGNYLDMLSPDVADVLRVPCARSEKKTQDELISIRSEYGKRFAAELGTDDTAWQEIWDEVKKPASSLTHVEIARLPADAIAFYRPFHFEPYKSWGIYILVDRLMNYCRTLHVSLGALRSVTPSTLAVCVVFEVFQHEFFHHMSESTATAIEIVCAGLGQPRRIYLDYSERRYEEYLGTHPDHPLEEALANAYAFNSFSFISRMRIGYLDRLASLYQEVLMRSWPKDPPGYREAGSYTKGEHTAGAAQLLSMFLAGPGKARAPLRALARSVFPSGHTAFVAKPDIPTYLVGKAEDLESFYELVPAPNESYTNLFWPGDTRELDRHIQQAWREGLEMKKRKVVGEQLSLI